VTMVICPFNNFIERARTDGKSITTIAQVFKVSALTATINVTICSAVSTWRNDHPITVYCCLLHFLVSVSCDSARHNGRHTTGRYTLSCQTDTAAGSIAKPAPVRARAVPMRATIDGAVILLNVRPTTTPAGSAGR